MNRASIVEQIISGCVIGLVAVAGGVLAVFLVWRGMILLLGGDASVPLGFFIVFYVLPFLAGTILGGVLGATVVHKLLRQRSPFSPGTQGVISPGDLLKQQPGQAKCPFCQSTTFHVEEEAGFRRCSDCHSVLPNYIQGNR